MRVGGSLDIFSDMNISLLILSSVPDFLSASFNINIKKDDGEDVLCSI